MAVKLLVFLSVFIVGELIVNNTLFAYIKSYFKFKSQDENKFLFFNISVFKGVLERFVLFLALSMDLSQILIVFGAIKIGTRINPNQDRIKNDYFLIGNFFTILVSILYILLYSIIMEKLK